MAENQTKRAFGVFRNHQAAEDTVHDLKAANFPMEHVSIIAREAEPDQQLEGAEITDHVGQQNINTPTRVVANTLQGTVWGTVLVGLTSLALPGVGPVLAAGTLGVALAAGVAGAGVGTVATRNLIEALRELGLPKAQAEIYSDRLLYGNYLMMLEGSDAELEQAESIVNQHDVQDWHLFDGVAA